MWKLNRVIKGRPINAVSAEILKRKREVGNCERPRCKYCGRSFPQSIHRLYFRHFIYGGWGYYDDGACVRCAGVW